jgi:hypothetical protein
MDKAAESFLMAHNTGPDPLTAAFITVAIIGALGLLFAVTAAIADYVITPWLQERQLERLLRENEKFNRQMDADYDEACKRG